ncbi:MAG: hypothetical protein WBN66_05750 [Smithella sp.]
MKLLIRGGSIAAGYGVKKGYALLTIGLRGKLFSITMFIWKN